MKNVLKLKVNADKLENEIKSALLKEYGIRVDVTKAPGYLTLPGLDSHVHAFTLKELETGNRTACLAIGYSYGSEGEWRIYTHLSTYCPKCGMYTAGHYCFDCGTKLQYRLE